MNYTGFYLKQLTQRGMKTRTQELVSDESVEKAFVGTNFDSHAHRDVIRYSLLKYASGYTTGLTAKIILLELDLIDSDRAGSKKTTLTKKGKEYLYEAFCDGVSM